MTSLYRALFSKDPVDTTTSAGRKLRHWYYLDIDRIITGSDIDDAIVSLPEDRKVRQDFGKTVTANYSQRELEVQGRMFPLNIAFSMTDIFSWQNAFITTHTQSGSADWNAFYLRALERINGYVIPAIILNKETTKDAVCTVFEKVNTGGMPLDAFELLTATFAADGFDLRKSWEDTRAVFRQSPVLGEFRSTEFLQVISLLVTYRRHQDDSSVPIGCKRKDLLDLEVGDYDRERNAAREAVVWAGQWLAARHIYRSLDVPYSTQIIALAALKALTGPGVTVHGSARKLEQWYWCGVFGELYGGSTETRLAQDIEQVPLWLTGGPNPRTVDDAAFLETRLSTLRTRLSAAYKGLSALLLASNPKDWIHDQAIDHVTFHNLAADIHHIFPKAWCLGHGLKPERFDSIVNKTVIAAETNRAIGGIAPSRYLRLIEKKAGLQPGAIDWVLQQHHIDPEALRGDDFEQFWGRRSRRLLDLVESAMGKPVGRSAVEEPAYDPSIVGDDETDEFIDDQASA